MCQQSSSLGLLFTVMLDVCFLLRKTMESLCSWVFMKVALTVPERNGKWRQCERVWLACSATELHIASLRLERLTAQWDVMWNASEMVRVRSSPPSQNKTWEKHMTMEWSWWRTFASRWPPASQTGPPVKHAPLPWVTQCSTSMSHSCEWKRSVPVLNHMAHHLWPWKQKRFCSLNPNNLHAAHS